MQSTDLNQLERAVCNWIATHTGSAALTKQLESASVRRRDYIRTGFFVYLETPSDVTRCDGVRPRCPQIIGPQLPYGAGCNLFLKDGRIDYLEIYTQGGFMPEAMDHFELVKDS